MLEELIVLSVSKVFGHASVEIVEVQDVGLDIQNLVNERNWTLITGTIVYGVLPIPVRHELQFGDKPDKKTLRKMVKEAHNVSQSKS